MFSFLNPTPLSLQTPPELRAGFDTLAEAIGDADRGAATEVFWSALHGIGLLERAGRMRPGDRALRVADLGVRFAAGTPVWSGDGAGHADDPA